MKNTADHPAIREYPLSKTQLGILAESLAAADTALYNIPCLYRLADGVDAHRLRDAVRKALKAHPYLSMTIGYDAHGEPAARRSAENLIDVDFWEHLPDAGALVLPFDLSEGKKLCRAAVIEGEAGKYLFLDMHHIVADDASVQILLQDIQAAYDGGR